MIFRPTGEELKAMREKAGLSVEDLTVLMDMDDDLVEYFETHGVPECQAYDDEESTVSTAFWLKWLTAIGMNPIPPLDEAEELIWLRAWKETAESFEMMRKDKADVYAQAALEAHRGGQR